MRIASRPDRCSKEINETDRWGIHVPVTRLVALRALVTFLMISYVSKEGRIIRTHGP
jgi:hypothetical protein